MAEARPDPAGIRRQVITDLSVTFAVSDVDTSGFTLQRTGRTVRVHLTDEQMAAYTAVIEDSAHHAIGLEPPWRSAVSLAAVHILEEAAMAEPGTSVVLDGAVIRRDPPDDVPTVAADGPSGAAWSVRTPVSGAVKEFGPDER